MKRNEVVKRASDCICRKRSSRPSKSVARKYGKFRRGSNYVQRYLCKLCGRTFTPKPRRKEEKGRGRPLSVINKPANQFKSYEDYCLVQIVAKMSKASGWGFYKLLSKYVPLTKKQIGQRIAKKFSFATNDLCLEALEDYFRFYLGMIEGGLERRSEEWWCNHTKHNLIFSAIESATGQPVGNPAYAFALADSVIERRKQQPLFSLYLEEGRIFNSELFDYPIDDPEISKNLGIDRNKYLVLADEEKPMLKESFLHLDITELLKIDAIKNMESSTRWENITTYLPDNEYFKGLSLQLMVRSEKLSQDFIRVHCIMPTNLSEDRKPLIMDFRFCIQWLPRHGHLFWYRVSGERDKYCKRMYMSPCGDGFYPREYFRMRYSSYVKNYSEKRAYTFLDELRDANIYWATRQAEQDRTYSEISH